MYIQTYMLNLNYGRNYSRLLLVPLSLVILSHTQTVYPYNLLTLSIFFNLLGYVYST